MSEPTFNDNAYQIAKQTITELRADLSEALEQLKAFTEPDDCNFIKNGRCETLACMREGGHEHGERPDFSMATCRHRRAATIVAKHGGADAD